MTEYNSQKIDLLKRLTKYRKNMEKHLLKKAEKERERRPQFTPPGQIPSRFSLYKKRDSLGQVDPD